jgi:hypothetical protein
MTELRGTLALLLAGMALTACGSGNSGTPPLVSTNPAPSLTGTPPTSVAAGSAYSFTPVTANAAGQAVSFSITGKPSWATFSSATGALTGTPTVAQAGSYPDIAISATVGASALSLPVFTITVTAGSTNGTATLSWSAPSQNADGSALTDLAGYRVYHGTAAGFWSDVVQVTSTSTGYTYGSLPSGTHYFAVTAFNLNGGESALSAAGTKVVP